MTSTVKELIRRADKLAPAAAPLTCHFLNSTDYADETERAEAAAELRKTPGNHCIECDIVDGAHPGDAEGTTRVFWRRDL